MIANFNLYIEPSHHLFLLFWIKGRSEVIEHKIVVQKHIEEKVAALLERNFIIDDCEEFFSFSELLETLLYSLFFSGECHCVSKHGLISDESLLSIDFHCQVFGLQCNLCRVVCQSLYRFL